MSKNLKELYVGSLSYDATEYDLEKLFSVSGTVTSIHLIVDLKTGEFNPENTQNTRKNKRRRGSV